MLLRFIMASGFRRMPAGSPRLSVEMGLTAVVATQLWHHLFIGGELAEPAWTDRGTMPRTYKALTIAICAL